MEKLNNIFLLSISNLWFLSAILICMIVIAIRFFRVTINELRNKNNDLLRQVNEQQTQLENSLDKELKATQQADQIDTAKGKLLASMSHEIRTPMNGVIGMASLLAETTLNEEQRDYTETILGCAKTLLTRVNDILISDMLDFSKLDSNKGELDQKKFDLRNCIEEVMDMFAGKTAETGLDLVYQLDSNVPFQIVGDNKRLRQVLINLIENAFKFTQQGEIFIGVHLLENKGSEQIKLGFEVSDSGIGIPAEILDTIFTGFLPADYSTKNKQAGAGFGLVICKKLVELMGGEIKAEKRPKAGTSFKFTILVNAAADLQNAAQNMIGFEGENILIADDNLITRNVLKTQLEQWKLLPVLADTGKQALESLTQVSFDLVIVDLNMPEMDGIELAQHIKKQYPKIPIILLNPLNDERYKQHADLFGAIISKPIKQHTLFDNILSELRHRNKPASQEQNVMHKMTENFSKLYPLHILIAEDNPINQKWITKILKRLGYEYKIGNNGKEVLEIISPRTI